MKTGTVEKMEPRFKRPLLLAVLAGLFLVALIGVDSVHSITKDASFCVSCHVMQPAYGTWSHSSHREIVDCNGCHTDQRNYLTKTYSKVTSGVKHLVNNTFGDIPPRIRIATADEAIVQQNCIRCHGEVTRNVRMDPTRSCSDCHRYTPHSNFR
ncbi:NapC/NirT family cytochrome c [Zhaonella formicivorans]|jgi:cytochrome c nitrite reductase small subunit|uniref:NapC/NirT family cytochrome c n=1 Tax=Zhaonella formicivorans TaxID=2528593 RepID=UPI0010D55F32|nr:NapC/NirT family cytochrome c [Zhaonella formicivorans]